MSASPAVRFVSSADGTGIAYWTIGTGRPLIYLPALPFSHVEREWAIPELRDRFQRLASDRMLVRYDGRGFGLADREPERMTPDAHVEDLVALLDHLQITECDLFGHGDAGMIAVRFARRHPERVGRLVLWNAWARREVIRRDPRVQSLRALWDQDWHTYTELAASALLGWQHRDQAGALASYYRDGATRASISRLVSAFESDDFSDDLGSVQAETLVVRVDQHMVDLTAETRRIASLVPNAEMRVVPGVSGFFDLFDDEDHVVSVISDFLADTAEPSDDWRIQHRESGTGSSLRVVLFTDIVDHSAMMSRLGDSAGREVLRAHEATTRSVLARHGGVEIKSLGDGFMATFGSAARAIECAVELQQRVSEISHDLEPIRLRMGLNAGEPIEDRGDLFGAAVILAARIAAQAAGGEILVPESVRGLLAGKGHKFSDHGEFTPKGFDEPIRLFEVVT